MICRNSVEKGNRLVVAEDFPNYGDTKCGRIFTFPHVRTGNAIYLLQPGQAEVIIRCPCGMAEKRTDLHRTLASNCQSAGFYVSPSSLWFRGEVGS